MEKEGRSRTAEELRWEQERLMNKKEKLLELLIDGILEKEDYRKRRAEVDERLGKLELQLGKAGASEGTENGPAGEMPDFRERMKKIQEIYGKRKDMDLSIPVIASHVKQVRIYASRIEVYADFLEPERPVTVAVSMNSGRRSYEFAREDRGVKEKID